VGGDFSDIGIPLGVGPVAGEDGAGIVVLLDLPDGLAGPASGGQPGLQAQLQPADPAEQGANADHGFGFAV